jgi:hypothetical protein
MGAENARPEITVVRDSNPLGMHTPLQVRCHPYPSVL